MLATSNSRDNNPAGKRQFQRKMVFSNVISRGRMIALMALLLAGVAGLRAADPVPDRTAEFAKRAENAYKAAKVRYQADTNNPEAIWQFGRTCFDWADFSTSNAKREEIANEAI